MSIGREAESIHIPTDHSYLIVYWVFLSVTVNDRANQFWCQAFVPNVMVNKIRLADAIVSTAIENHPLAGYKTSSIADATTISID